MEKTVGAAVFAGSINQSGALEIRAERIGRDTSYGKIIEAVEQAERSRAPVQRLADRLAGYLVYFALGAAVLTYLLTRNSPLDDFGRHRRRRLRYCSRHTPGNSRRHRPRCPRRRHRQGRAVSRAARQSGHRGSGQDGHPHVRASRSCARSFPPREWRARRCSMQPHRPSCARSTHWARRSSRMRGRWETRCRSRSALATPRVAASTLCWAGNWFWWAIRRSCALTASRCHLQICSPVIRRPRRSGRTRRRALLGAIVIADSVRPEAGRRHRGDSRNGDQDRSPDR